MHIKSRCFSRTPTCRCDAADNGQLRRTRAVSSGWYPYLLPAVKEELGLYLIQHDSGCMAEQATGSGVLGLVRTRGVEVDLKTSFSIECRPLDHVVSVVY